jgi:hypothetical protein
VVTKGFLRKVVKPPRLNVTLELTVPGCPVVFQEPGAKLRKLVRGERLDLLLDLFDLAHDPSSVPESSIPPDREEKRQRVSISCSRGRPRLEMVAQRAAPVGQSPLSADLREKRLDASRKATRLEACQDARVARWRCTVKMRPSEAAT